MRLECGCRKALSFDDVFIKPKRSALGSRDFQISRTFEFLHSNRAWSGVPIIAANMDHTGTFKMLDALNEFDCMTALHKHNPDIETFKYYVENSKHDNMWFSIGLGDNELENLKVFVGIIRSVDTHFEPKVCIDVANGYTEYFAEFVSKVRKEFPNAVILAGNVATYEMTEQLILSGADIVKIGIGPGSVCTTRKVTGVGYPQLSAIDECSDAAHGLGGLICADGGCENSGHIAKAFAAGADFVMLGGMLAGHDQCDGEYVYPDGSELPFKPGDHIIHPGDVYRDEDSGLYKKTEACLRDFPEWLKSFAETEPVGMKFYGMSSAPAQERHYGGVRTYRAPEGKEVVVPYRGDVKGTVSDILGGIRSCMTYIGAKRLKDIPKCATLVPTRKQLNESFS